MKNDQDHDGIPFTEEIRAAIYGQHLALAASIRALAMSLPDPVEYHLRFAREREQDQAMLLNLPCHDMAIESYRVLAAALDVELTPPSTRDDPEA